MPGSYNSGKYIIEVRGEGRKLRKSAVAEVSLRVVFVTLVIGGDTVSGTSAADSDSEAYEARATTLLSIGVIAIACVTAGLVVGMYYLISKLTPPIPRHQLLAMTSERTRS